MTQEFRAFLLRDLATSARLDIAELRLSAPVPESATWVDARLAVELDEILCATRGERELVLLARRAALRSVESSVLAPLVRIVVKLFGARPEAMFRWGPGFYAAATRGLGRLSFLEGERGGTVTFVDVPDFLRGSTAWRVEILGRLLGGFDLIGVEATVDELPDGAGYTVRW